MFHVLPQPGLLPKEKENHPPSLEKPADWVGRDGLPIINKRVMALPSPGEKAQVEGERETFFGHVWVKAAAVIFCQIFQNFLRLGFWACLWVK